MRSQVLCYNYLNSVLNCWIWRRITWKRLNFLDNIWYLLMPVVVNVSYPLFYFSWHILTSPRSRMSASIEKSLKLVVCLFSPLLECICSWIQVQWVNVLMNHDNFIFVMISDTYVNQAHEVVFYSEFQILIQESNACNTFFIFPAWSSEMFRSCTSISHNALRTPPVYHMYWADQMLP